MATLTEQEAYRLIDKLQDEGQMMILCMGRSDFERQAGSELTDEEWDRVISTDGFDDGFSNDAILEVAWMIVDSILEDAEVT